MSDPGDLRLLEGLREDRRAAAPHAAKERIAERLAIGLSPSSRPRPVDAPSGAWNTVSGRMMAMLLAAFVAGGAAGALVHARLTPVPQAQVIYVDRAKPLATAMPAAAATPATAAASPTGAETSTATTPPTPSTGASARPRLSQLDAERDLLDVARAALVNGDTDAALSALDRHERTFGEPLLAEERDAMWIQTLVRAGRYDEARSRADAFRRKAPQSILLPAVNAAIASIP